VQEKFHEFYSLEPTKKRYIILGSVECVTISVLRSELRSNLNVSKVLNIKDKTIQKGLLLLLGKGLISFIDLCIIMTKTNIATTINQPDKLKEYVNI
jgi:hypothetical protein